MQGNENKINDDPISLLSKPWQKFLNKFAEIETEKVCKWKEIHFLAYFCKKFEAHYSRKFALSFKGPPSKCTEIILIKKMCAMLGTTNPLIIKEYIDWIFETKIIPQKLNIRTLAYLMTPGIGNEFLSWRKEKTRIYRTTELPKEYLEIIHNLDLPVQTYGDLVFIKSALEESPNSESRAPYRDLFKKLYSIGFDPEVLKTIV